MDPLVFRTTYELDRELLIERIHTKSKNNNIKITIYIEILDMEILKCVLVIFTTYVIDKGEKKSSCQSTFSTR